MTVWLVRAGAHGEQEELALSKGLVCVAWDDVPNLAQFTTRDAVEEILHTVSPADGDGRVRNHSIHLFAFAHEIAKGDIVVLPLKTRAQIAIGRVADDYRYRQDLGPGARHVRGVKWLRPDLPRTELGPDLLHSLGAFLTVCRIARNDAESRIQAVLGGAVDPGYDDGGSELTVDDDEPAIVARDIETDANDQISAFVIDRFKGHDMARLVDAVLRADGYVTLLSPAGPDGGVDILAGSGRLGLEGPRLCVQVKSSVTAADVKILRELQGSMARFKADQGLLVSWGGLTEAARREARDSFFSVRIWDARELLQAVFRTYERLPEDLRAELPLKRVWALVPEQLDT